VPFRHLGRTRFGLDCAGLLIVCAAEVCRTRIVIEDYSAWPSPKEMRRLCNKILLKIKREELAPGDVVLLKTPAGVVHLGFYSGDTLIHASNDASLRRVVEHRLDEDWQRLIMGTYRMPAWDYEG
jgi:cell wall-associated NlpC family hydrolase